LFEGHGWLFLRVGCGFGERYVAGFLHQLLSLRRLYPGEQFAYVVVFPADDGDGVEVVGEGVVARADVGVVGGDAVDLQQFDFFFRGHLRAVK